MPPRIVSLVLRCFLVRLAMSVACAQEAPLQSMPKPGNLEQLRSSYRQDSRDLAAACALARRFLDQHRNSADSRDLDAASEALKPWLNSKDPPVEVRLLRATMLQREHHFKEALQELEHVLAADRRNVQAWLTKTMVLQVLGRFDEARATCLRLVPLTSPLVAVTCSCSVGSLGPDAAAQYELLRDTLENARGARRTEQLWALSALGEIAERLGFVRASEEHYRAALELDPSDAHVRGALADLLIDDGRPEDAVRVVEKHTHHPNLLLRLALAEKAAGIRGAAQELRIERLQQYFQRDILLQRSKRRRVVSVSKRPCGRLAKYIAQ